MPAGPFLRSAAWPGRARGRGAAAATPHASPREPRGPCAAQTARSLRGASPGCQLPLERTGSDARCSDADPGRAPVACRTEGAPQAAAPQDAVSALRSAQDGWPSGDPSTDGSLSMALLTDRTRSIHTGKLGLQYVLRTPRLRQSHRARHLPNTPGRPQGRVRLQKPRGGSTPGPPPP